MLAGMLFTGSIGTKRFILICTLQSVVYDNNINMWMSNSHEVGLWEVIFNLFRFIKISLIFRHPGWIYASDLYYAMARLNCLIGENIT